MRWIVMRLRANRLSSERGASAVMVAILLVPLIGFVAISVDVGALYWERAQLQNGADAAALAIAQDCADDTGCGDSTALAASYANDNAIDGAANVLAPVFPNAHTVIVSDSTRVAGTDAEAIRHPFAALIGTTSTTVGASATAEWGPPGAGPVLPLALSFCEFEESLPLVPGTLMSIRTDKGKKCKKDEAEIPGGFGWVDHADLDGDGDSCEAYVNLNAAGELWLGNDTGNNVPDDCEDRLDDIKNTTILIPIYDASAGSGTKGTYRIYAFAAFHVTGWYFSDSKHDVDGAAPSCGGGSGRCVQGYFDKWVSVESAFELGGPETNSTLVKLIN
ncbi:MAG: TadE/TadG family type IV pilus assembly protein [Mycetocola sp.]